MSVEAPERIRVAQDSDGFWTCREAVSGSQEYVRADKLEELAERARYAEGVAFLAMQRVGKAEAALAEAKRENEALRKHLQVAAGRLQWSANTTTDSQKSSLLNDWADEARNAGGNDEPCRGCGDGDKVPASGYWRCPVCDAEWSGEDAE